MTLGLITLLTALCISGIAAYYSIIGLTAIFAAAVIPIIIMGVALELGKVVSTVWLHYNWERAEWKIKSYLTAAVAVLMFITSLGIFGFLSKAHLEQAVPSGDIQAQVSLYDEKIATQKDNIASARKALVQLDSAVDQTMARTTDDTGATRSANLRRSQAKERVALQKDIDVAQKTITKLQEERAPVASQFRKVEAEVGPIRYVAALIYGDNPDQNLLESAVRWVIIIIVFVFDPLAIVLILAATSSIDWSKLDRRKKKHDDIVEQIEETKEAAELAALQAQADAIPIAGSPLPEPVVTSSPSEDLLKLIEEASELTRAECAAEASQVLQEAADHAAAEVEELRQKYEDELALKDSKISQLNGDLEKAVELILEQPEESKEVAAIIQNNAETLLETPTTDEKTPEVTSPIVSADPQPLPVAQFPAKHKVVLPPLEGLPDNFPRGGNAHFGVTFPKDPEAGDLFLRVDMVPSTLFKWSGDNWFQVDKNLTDTYAYDKEYIKLLVAKVESGEYDIDDLNQTEQDQIALYLNEQTPK